MRPSPPSCTCSHFFRCVGLQIRNFAVWSAGPRSRSHSSGELGARATRPARPARPPVSPWRPPAPSSQWMSARSCSQTVVAHAGDGGAAPGRLAVNWPRGAAGGAAADGQETVKTRCAHACAPLYAACWPREASEAGPCAFKSTACVVPCRNVIWVHREFMWTSYEVNGDAIARHSDLPRHSRCAAS